jgi:hypothetical protein
VFDLLAALVTGVYWGLWTAVFAYPYSSSTSSPSLVSLGPYIACVFLLFTCLCVTTAVRYTQQALLKQSK